MRLRTGNLDGELGLCAMGFTQRWPAMMCSTGPDTKQFKNYVHFRTASITATLKKFRLEISPQFRVARPRNILQWYGLVASSLSYPTRTLQYPTIKELRRN